MMLTHMRTRLLAAVITVAFAVLPAWASQEEFHKTVALDANGDVTVKNVNGNVEITAWDRNEVQIDAYKSADSDRKLHDTTIEVFGSGHSVEVKTKYPGMFNNNPCNVQYKIHVPWGARIFEAVTVNGSVKIDGPRGRIKASTVNGSVEVWNAASELELSTVNGEVKASLQTAGKEPLKLTTVNGTVSVALPISANVHLKASTVNGDIHSDLPVSVERPKFGPGAHVDSNLGSGGPTVEMNSVNGSIYLHKV